MSPRVDVTEPLSLELDDFCRAIRTGSGVRASVELGIDVVRMVDAAERSLGNGGARTAVPPAIEPLSRATR